MQKQVMTSVDECNQMQQFWLRQQNDLVKKTRSSEEQRNEIDHLEKQLLVMNQKKLRIDGKPKSPKVIITVDSTSDKGPSTPYLRPHVHFPIVLMHL